MLRKLYYFLPPRLRFFVRWLIYLPYDLWSGHSKELIPPRGRIYTGRGDFVKQGQDWVQFFKDYGSLQPEDTILDIGSGIGRIAIPLMSYIKNNYEGFDAVKMGVEWCQKNITRRNPRFKFTFIDLFNDLYNSRGHDASTFVFPYEDQKFDFVCAISVFSHMLPEEIENYLHQIYRVLKPGGHVVLTFFILDEESQTFMKEHTEGLQFKFRKDDRHTLLDQKVKAANVAYHRTYLMSTLAQHPFNLIRWFKGHWCGRMKEHELAFQDIVVLSKHV